MHAHANHINLNLNINTYFHIIKYLGGLFNITKGLFSFIGIFKYIPYCKTIQSRASSTFLSNTDNTTLLCQYTTIYLIGTFLGVDSLKLEQSLCLGPGIPYSPGHTELR